jgi:hypothetical protein
MLPMLFAPQDDQIVQREFVPPNLTANSHRAWGRARELAQHYWRGLTDDTRISDEFRRLRLSPADLVLDAEPQY